MSGFCPLHSGAVDHCIKPARRRADIDPSASVENEKRINRVYL